MSRARSAGQKLAKQCKAGKVRLISEICETRDMQSLARIAEDFTRNLDGEPSNHQPLHIVLVGIGGSILSPYLFAPFAKDHVRVHRLTRPDPRALAKLLAQLDVQRTRFLVMSKSGETAETLSLFLCILDWLEQKKAAPYQYVIAISQTGQNTLRRLAKSHAIRTIDGEADINSRFSLFTALGMFPALVMGLDAEALRRSARDCIINFFDAIAQSQEHDILTSVLFNVWGGVHGKNIHAMIVTDPRLEALCHWWQQIFSESLGKNDQAITPIWAQLPDDLHIRFQLYLDGPKDKIFTCLTGFTDESPATLNTRGEKNLGWLENKNLGELMRGQEKVALLSLERNQSPTRIIKLPQIDEAVYGDLLMRFVLEILVLAECWGVSPFGQPAIEQGKIDLVEFMGKSKEKTMKGRNHG